MSAVGTAKPPALVVGGRWYPTVMAGLALGLLSLAGMQLAYGVLGPPRWDLALGNDLDFYAEAARRLFSGESWYLDRQLHGPYEIVYFADVLYPPVAGYLFAPFIVLPVAVLWAIAGGVLWRLWREWRPAPWSWPLIALCVVSPLVILKVWSGNSSLLTMMAVGLGLRYGWAGALVLLKPSFAPFALIGIWTRGWWITAGIMALLSLPFLGDTLLYPRVILDSHSPEGFFYSFVDLPIVLLPVAMWRGRTHDSR